ncbi:Glycosyltransferase involved in cell wall bisynthesis [Agromyces sp. CF514]|uniref:glycosyltransferase n=1 Tax=Agromyces sp. CF514 TaxID=1881031 RepID=UPI0008E19CE9|nr:glycosyltransferase [Agromyces sp. CF514]SFR86346.1 Glycosyltransferase involved in cell wall bisynthesis [Agromyces sp. CF514]
MHERPERSIAIITCYKHPDYVRAASLRAAARSSGLFDEVEVVKNRSRGLSRYPQVIGALVRMMRRPPSAYLVTFRGYEILPFVLLLSRGRPVYYDEFINPVEWFVHEHGKFREGSIPARLMRSFFRRLMLRSAGVLTDTESHADRSAELMDLPRSLFTAVPVGTDEAAFRPAVDEGAARASGTGDGVFRVLYYGSMLPLHGLEVVLEAAEQLAGESGIAFGFVGGDDADAALVERARAAGAQVEHRAWVPYEELPQLFARHDLMLGGPFGGTEQAQYVITGKTYQFLASALPVVVGANLESGVLTDRVDALIVPQSDPAALAQTIRWAREHGSELDRIGANGRATYERLFSVDRVADRLRIALGAEHAAEVEHARDAEEHRQE